MGLADLKERIAVESSPAELVPIVQRLNEMLERLDAAFVRERAFTGNVAHELRTPLAGIKAAIEVFADQPRDPAEYRRVLGECAVAVELMHRMVESLLSITRLGAGQITLRLEPVPLAPFVHACWEHIEKRNKRIDVEWAISDDAAVDADPHLLRSICTNLLDNAASYVNDGGSIRIVGHRADGQIELSVSNTGSTVSSEEVAKVFEPFWRADASRTSGGRHCGLGLTLTRGYTELMGGSAHATSADGVFTATFGFAPPGLTRVQTREPRSLHQRDEPRLFKVAVCGEGFGNALVRMK